MTGKKTQAKRVKEIRKQNANDLRSSVSASAVKSDRKRKADEILKISRSVTHESQTMKVFYPEPDKSVIYSAVESRMTAEERRRIMDELFARKVAYEKKIGMSMEDLKKSYGMLSDAEQKWG